MTNYSIEHTILRLNENQDQELRKHFKQFKKELDINCSINEFIKLLSTSLIENYLEENKIIDGI